MRIEQARAALEPRNAWQAMDLGLAFWRDGWRALLAVWLAFTLVPLVVLLVLFSERPWLAGLLFWWLKPLWDRPLLEYQARALFGEYPGVRQLLREFPRYGLPGLVELLSWRRFSPWRSFHLPVFQLEQAGPRHLSRRLRRLHQPPSSRAGVLTIVMLHLEQAFTLALVILLYMLLPWQFNVAWDAWILYAAEQWLSVAAWYLAMTLIEPLYVCCGFALYLNQRGRMEAWDLEPGLRRIGQRRAGRTGRTGMAPVMLLALPLLALLPLEAQAASEPEKAWRDDAARVLAQPEFMPMTEQRRWRLREAPDREDNGNGGWQRALEWFLERERREPAATPDLSALRPLVILAVALALLWLFWRLGHRLELPERGKTDRIRSVVLRTEPGRRTPALPRNLTAAVEAALAADNPRAALGLLYRATLERLDHDHDRPLAPGATEQECLRHHNDELLAQLARTWMATAWAHRGVTTEEIRALLAQWQERFAQGAHS